jgi:hypothetical protein
MKEQREKDRNTNAMKKRRKDGWTGGKDRLENEDMRVYSTCRLRTAERGILTGSILEDSLTTHHQVGCREQSENKKIY